jgi:hypothetical protein
MVLLVLLVVAAICLGGWYVWSKNRKDNNPDKANKKTVQVDPNQNKDKNNAKPVDIYEGWQTYNNSTYGINFRYPADWKIDEVASSPNSSSPGRTTSVEYAINLKRNEEVKYSETISIEVLNASLDKATAWYDEYFARSPSNKVNKSVKQLKERQSVQYVVAHADGETKLYLFSVGDKTYLFTSIHEWLSLQSEPDYWMKFDKIFDSLQI